MAASQPDWRLSWYRGVVALAAGEPGVAASVARLLYRHLPGELAPKLALGHAAEQAGDHEQAARWYDIVSRVDPALTSAAFGLARAEGDGRPSGSCRCLPADPRHVRRLRGCADRCGRPVARPRRRRWRPRRRAAGGGDRRGAGPRPRAAGPPHRRCPLGRPRHHQPERHPGRPDGEGPRPCPDRPRRAARAGGRVPRRRSPRLDEARNASRSWTGPTRSGPGPGGSESSMSTEPLLGCPVCAPGLAGDTFCEAWARKSVSRATQPDIRGDRPWDRGRRHRPRLGAPAQRGCGPSGVGRGRRGAVAVCDGVSSSTGSEVAAQVAAEELGRSGAGGPSPAGGPSRRLGRGPGRPRGGRPSRGHRRHHPVDGRRRPERPVVHGRLAVWDGTDVTVGWLGDSRAYWVDEDGCRQLTVDHSWAEDQVSAGRLDRESAEADSRAHAITRWAGADAPPAPVRSPPSVRRGAAASSCARTDSGTTRR